MRVVAGTARGRRLVAPGGTATRPTSDRVREATFNALGSLDVVQESTVIDLFAGSGALGIEALSRGAASVTFVERDRGALTAIRTNLETCGFTDRAEVLQSSAERVLAEARVTGRAWDLALLDPPYGHDAWDDLLGALPAPLAVLESGQPVVLPPGWEAIRSKRYGSTTVVIARRDSSVPEGDGPRR